MDNEKLKKLVNKLRCWSGAGAMDCKKALKACNYNFEQAKMYIKHNGIPKCRDCQLGKEINAKIY